MSDMLYMHNIQHKLNCSLEPMVQQVINNKTTLTKVNYIFLKDSLKNSNYKLKAYTLNSEIYI